MPLNTGFSPSTSQTPVWSHEGFAWLAASETSSSTNTLYQLGWSPHLPATETLLAATDIYPSKIGKKINTGFAKAPEFALFEHSIAFLNIALKPDPYKSLFLQQAVPLAPGRGANKTGIEAARTGRISPPIPSLILHDPLVHFSR